MSQNEKQPTQEELLQGILHHLEKMDRRDKLRMIGSTIRSIVTIIPTIAILYALYYVSENTDTLLKKIAAVAVEATNNVSNPIKTTQETLRDFWKK